MNYINDTTYSELPYECVYGDDPYWGYDGYKGYCSRSNSGFWYYYWYIEDDDGTWQLVNTIETPIYKYDAFDINVIEIQYEYWTGTPIIKFEVSYLYKVYDWDKWHEVDDYETDVIIDINANGEKFTFTDTFNYYGETRSFQIRLDNFDLSEEINIIADLYNDEGFSKSVQFEIWTNREKEYLIDLRYTDNLTLKLPIYFSKEDYIVRYETFEFNTINSVTSKYPTKLSHFLTIDYYNDIHNIGYNPKSIGTLSMNLNGVEDTYHEWYYENNKFFFNDYYIYDYEDKITKISNDGEKAFILPLDYRDNYGVVEMPLTLRTYGEITFKIIFYIGNEHSYRGDEESLITLSNEDYIEPDVWTNIITIHEDDIEKGSISRIFVEDNLYDIN